MHIYIYTYISYLHKRGVIAEWVKAASGNQKVVRSNPGMSDVFHGNFPNIYGKINMNYFWTCGDFIICFWEKFYGKNPPQFRMKQRPLHVFLVNGLFCCNSAVDCQSLDGCHLGWYSTLGCSLRGVRGE